MPRSLAPATALLLVLAAPSARAGDTWSTPHPGVRHLFRTTATPQRIHVLEVDLCHPGVALRATKPDERGRTTSSFAQLVKVQAAINGDFFSSGNNYRTTGLAVGSGVRWDDTKDNGEEGFYAFGPGRAQLSAPGQVVEPPAAWMRHVVSGRPQIVKDGAAIDGDPATAACTTRNPRTAVGLSRDGRTLYLAVVDGRTEIAAGMKCTELGALMKSLGAWTALNFDGGGSSTMWIAGDGVVNDPSDGAQRVVGNHLGVWADGLGDPGSCDRSREESTIAGDVQGASPTTDVDGDGRADVCARAAAGIRCALAGAPEFAPTFAGPALADDTGWDDPGNYSTIRMGDLDGDGRADLCARGNAGVRCWHSLGDGFGPAFDGPDWSDADGWGAPEYHGTIRLADIDGDGRDDLCGRSAADFRCHLSEETGFGPAIALPALGDDAGFADPARHGTIRTADIDADGDADVCARTGAGVRCWPFEAGGFGPAIVGPEWSDDNGWTALQYWSTIRLADIDADGRADVCARAATGFRCHLSQGTGFGPAIDGPQWRDDNGWDDYDNYSTIRMADLDGDGRTDVCARANAKIVCARFDGAAFGPTFDGPLLADADGWNVHERYSTIRLADVDGDRRADLCARAAGGLTCWLSDGAGFPQQVAGPAWSDDKGWRNLQYYSTIHVAGPRCSAIELCNGRDDDCDGDIDEGCDPGTTSDSDTGSDTTGTTGDDSHDATGTTGSSPTTTDAPTTGPADPGTTGELPPATGSPETGDDTGCGCTTSSPPAPLALTLLLLLPRRRPRSP